MKYRYITFAVIFALIISIFFACKNETGETDSKVYSKVTNQYKLIEYDLPDEFFYSSYFAGYDDYVYIYGYLDSEYVTIDSYEVKAVKNYAQLKYNFEGELVETISITETTEAVTYGTTAGVQSNGNYVLMGYDIVCLVSADGKMLNSFDFIYDYGYDLFISKTDEVYMICGRKLYVFDKDLNPIAEIESTDSLERVMADADGNILVKSRVYNNVCFRYDPNTKTLTAYKDIESGQIFGLDSTIYTIDDNGVYDSSAKLLSWESSDILYKRTNNFRIVNEDIILCNIKDYFDEFYKPVILKRVPDDEVAEKVILKLAIMGFDNVGIIEEGVALFNRDNKTYRIVTVDYSIYNKAPNYDQGMEKLNQDLIKGNQPDVVMIHFTMFRNIYTYTDKNVFIDLTEAISNSEHKLLKCVESSYCNGDKIYHLPIFMELNTIVTKKSIIGENESFTLDKLYSLAESNKTLFSKPVDILNTAIYDFIDYDNKTCNFDSGDFIKLLEFQKNIGNYVDKEKGAINNFTGSYFLTSDNLYNSLANDELYFLHLPFNRLSGYLISKMCYGDDEFTICGYPTSTGNASMLFTEYTFGITEQSKVKNGAWEFIEFLLSDTIQNSETLTSYGFPVTMSGIEKLINTYAEYYLDINEPDSINNNEYSGEVSIIDRGVKEILPDNHMNKEFVEYVATITDEDKRKLLDFFNSTEVKSYTDDTITEIADEEFSAYESGAISAEETAKRIQNRVFTYINE